MLIVGGVVLLAAGAGSFLVARVRIPEVELISPSRGPVMGTVAVIGRVAPLAEVRFAAREPTSVTGVPVREGDHVEAGALLVHMDDAEARAMVDQARAALAQARARTREVATVTSKTADASLREARAQLAEAQRISQVDEALFVRGELSAAELDRSRTQLTVTRSRARAAELAAAASSRNGAQWQAAVAAETFAEAGLVVAESRVERLSVRAPAAGVVTKREVEVGDTVQPGTHLITLVLDGPKELLIEPDEKTLASLAEGQRARASAEAYPDQSFDATLRYIAPAVDPARGTIELRLSVPEPPGYLRTDMTVSVDLVTDEKEDALTLPIEAVADLSTDAMVFVYVEGRVEARRVRLGLRGSDRVELLEGVGVEEQVVARVDGHLEDGDRVRTRGP